MSDAARSRLAVAVAVFAATAALLAAAGAFRLVHDWYGLLLFPDGHLPSPRWRWPARAAATGIGLAMLAYTLAPWQGNDEFAAVPAGVENPLRATALGALHDPLLVVALPLLLAGIVAGVAALVVRYRRARAGERQQLKWAVAGGNASVTVYLTGDLTTRLPGIEWWLVTLVAAVVFPVTILVAVLRYRLYDIEALGDRRFNRARYDAQRTVEAFSQHLREHVDLSALLDDLEAAATSALQPRHLSVWQPGSPAGRGRAP